ncbi:Sporulation protein YpjB (SpoYpjB) [Lentibacillus persicus]|uniref:Sporulation protein YpjB (SpoYpjB) n=1 Tax=Lentibacillus persicus TaxID=640948 RepID=A0A1I2AQX0_9BACI|nr:sporulation protein YpjB [Lentibacillus persicus]SFE46107.1 Sporulation protein YpjB (SpoYpjB) [Lentibacillus persicus]
MKFTKRMLIAVIGIIICASYSAPAAASAQQYFPIAATSTANVTMAPFYWMIGIVGGSIAITLSYVGWRKYRGERKKQTDDDS